MRKGFAVSVGRTILFTGCVVHSALDPEATALVVDDGVVAWVGAATSARALFSTDPSLTVLEFDGHLITPSFVDSCSQGMPPCPELGITETVPGSPGFSPVTNPDVDFLGRAKSGATFAFGSGGADSSPWHWVRTAAELAHPSRRVSVRAAFLASSRAGRRLLGQDHPGTLVPGCPADLVVWEPAPLVVRGNDDRIQTWSTDPRARTPLLPDLSGGVPHAALTMKAGTALWSATSQYAPSAPDVSSPQ